MEGTKYKSGDFVRLKSGGPKMTVSEYVTYKKAYTCKWFVGAKLNEGDFTENEIEPWSDVSSAGSDAKK